MIIILPSIDPSFGLTLGQMIDEVAGQLRNDSISDKITGWLNFTMFDLASDCEFPFLHSSGTLPVTSGDPLYVLASDLYWLKLVTIPGQNPPIFPATEQDLSAADTYWETSTGTITHYVLHDRNIRFWKVPSGDKVVHYTYQRRPIKLTSLNQTPDFPYEWHQVLIQGAKVLGYEYERNPLLNEAIQRFVAMKKERTRGLYHRPDFPMIAKDNSTYQTYRPAGPVLPSNYPRVR